MVIMVSAVFLRRWGWPCCIVYDIYLVNKESALQPQLPRLPESPRRDSHPEYSTNQDGNLVLLGDPGRVRSQITSVVCQIQRFDFDCNLVVVRKLIIRTPPGLGSNPLYVRYIRNHTCKFLGERIRYLLTVLR